VWRLQHPDVSSNFEIFLVADKEQVSTPEFIDRLARAAGKRARLFAFPPRLLSSLFAALDRQDTIDSLFGSLELNVSKALAAGWRPEVSLDDGLRLAFTAKDV
jgi:UDP-glucose 4-epimerase